MKKPLYVIDVDGTVADNSHREKFIHQDQPDWETFFHPEQMMRDKPIESARRHFDKGRFLHGEHIYLTARIEQTIETTRAWLIENEFATKDTLLICKPMSIRRQRARIFKPSVLFTLSQYEYKDRNLILIEDYGEVRRATIEAGFDVLHAPDCWTEWRLS